MCPVWCRKGRHRLPFVGHHPRHVVLRHLIAAHDRDGCNAIAGARRTRRGWMDGGAGPSAASPSMCRRPAIQLGARMGAGDAQQIAPNCARGAGRGSSHGEQPSASLHIAPGRPIAPLDLGSPRTTARGLGVHSRYSARVEEQQRCVGRHSCSARTHRPNALRSAPAAARTGRPTELRAPGMGTGGDAGKGHGGHGRTVADVQASDQRHIRGPFIPAPAGRAARYCPGQCHTATGHVHVRLPAEECTCSAKEKTQTRGKATALHCAEAFENMAPPRVAIALKARARVYSSSSSCRIDSCTPSACPKGRR